MQRRVRGKQAPGKAEGGPGPAFRVFLQTGGKAAYRALPAPALSSISCTDPVVIGW